MHAGNDCLRYDHESKSMLCDICIKSQRSNTFTSGCIVMKKESVTKHAAHVNLIIFSCDNISDHALAVSAGKQNGNMETAHIPQPYGRVSIRHTVTTAMGNVLFSVKQNIPSSIVTELD